MNNLKKWICPQTSRGSFSAVSTLIFASKYSLESSRRDLHNALLCTVLQTQNFSQKSPTFFRDRVLNFWFLISCFSSNFAFFLRIFDEILSGFRDKFQERVTCVAFFFSGAFSIKFAKTNCYSSKLPKIKFWNLWKLVIIVHLYS